MIEVDRIVLREVHLPFVHSFETSFGRALERHALLVEVHSGDVSGWGECVADEGPFYSYETVHTAWSVLAENLIPRLLHAGLETPEEVPGLFRRIRGHPMAKASLESALWDVWARQREEPLWKVLGGTRERIPCGVSIGIQDRPEILLGKIEEEISVGYRKIKIKIKPGWDVEVVRLVRENFPDVPLMVDANSAYRLEDSEHLRRLDDFDLMMIEQPLYEDDIYLHGKLQRQLKTPICLDESIRHARDARHACEIGACRIVNIKMGRVGGHAEARKVHEVCREFGVPVWCGGMLETGIGRAHNIALSTLDGFSLPGDVSASRRYFERDVILPPVQVDVDGCIRRPERPGIGFIPDPEWIEEVSVRREVFER